MHGSAGRWRSETVLLLCAACALLLYLDIATFGAQLNAGYDGHQGTWLLLELFLLYRIYRGGALAWTILVGLNVLPLLMIVLGTSGWLGWYGRGLVSLIAVQTVLLFAPAVRVRVSGVPPLARAGHPPSDVNIGR